MNDRVAIIGLGLLGQTIVTSLAERGYPVLAIDNRAERVDAISRLVERAVCMDATDQHALESLRIHEMDIAVCTIGPSGLQSSILITALLRQFEVPRIIVRSADPLHERILRLVGATEVYNPEKEVGARLAGRLSRPGLLELIPIGRGMSVSDAILPESFVGGTLAELDLRRRYGVNVIGVRRKGEGSGQEKETIINLLPDTRLQAGDVLVLVGRDEDIERLSRLG